MKKRFESEQGFTLMEVLITMVVLAVGLLGMAGLTCGIMQGNDHTSDLTTATVLAQERIEDIRRIGYSVGTLPEESYNSISGFPNFRRVTTIAGGSPGANMKTVTVTVFWSGNGRSVALQTILAE